MKCLNLTLIKKLAKLTITRKVSSMIHSARPTVTPVANNVFYCFVLLDLKSGDGRTDVRTYRRTDERTDNMSKNNDPYRP